MIDRSEPDNLNLHDIPPNLPFRVEMWDQSDQHIRWVIGDYGVGKRCGLTRGDGCGDRELSGAAVHVQAVTAEPITTDSSTYEPVTCIMC